MTIHPIISAARSWIGTRFAHQGRLKKTEFHRGGVDCLGLLAGIARELELKREDGTPLIDFDRTDYGHNPERYALQEGLAALLRRVPLDQLQPGDIALMVLEKFPQHVAVISDYPEGGAGTLGMIHAYAAARKVVEHRLDDLWRARIVAAFRLA